MSSNLLAFSKIFVTAHQSSESHDWSSFDNDFEQSTALTDSTNTYSDISSMTNASQISLEKALSQRQCAIDIGGTLAKLVYIDTLENIEHTTTNYSSFESLKSSQEIGLPEHSLRKPNRTDVTSNKFSTISYGDCGIDYTDLTDDEYHLYLEYNQGCKDKDILNRRRISMKRLRIPISDNHAISFDHFPSQDIDSVIDFILDKNLISEGDDLNVTGGGAYKYSNTLTEKLKVQLKKKDEMQSIMKGLSFSLTLSNSVFRYDIKFKRRVHTTLADPIYPFLVVNIGSGVSILKAKSHDEFVRITGTCVGGGTVLGLAKLIFGAQSFNDVAKLADSGSDDLDLTVGDLFGEHLQSKHSLSQQTLASSFGKVFLMDHNDDAGDYNKYTNKANIARSLIRMVSYNLGYLTYLLGTIHDVHRVFFAGKYIDNHAFTMECLTYGVNFYQTQYPISGPRLSRDKSTNVKSHLNTEIDTNDYNPEKINKNSFFNKEGGILSTDDTQEEEMPNKFEVFFLKHDGYLGALGSFLS